MSKSDSRFLLHASLGRRLAIMAELRRATGELGIVVVNVTQCSQGSVSKIYSGGFALERAGVIAGGGLSMETSCPPKSLTDHLARRLIPPFQT